MWPLGVLKNVLLLLLLPTGSAILLEDGGYLFVVP